MYAGTHSRWRGTQQPSCVQLSLRGGEVSAERPATTTMLAVCGSRHNRYFARSGFPAAQSTPALDGTSEQAAPVGYRHRRFRDAGHCDVRIVLFRECPRRKPGPPATVLCGRWGGSRGAICRPYPARKSAGSTVGTEVSAMRFIGRIVDHWRWDYPGSHSAPIISRDYAGRNHAHS